MALILRAGDYVPDEKGGFQSAQGAQELLERALWKLTVRRGSGRPWRGNMWRRPLPMRT